MRVSYLLPRIPDLLTYNRGEDHFDILNKGIMPIIITIQPHLVGVDDGVVVFHGDVLGGAGVTGGLTTTKLF